MDERLTELNNDPSDWFLRCHLAHEFYESGQFEEAAALVREAPEIPADEESVTFAATVIGQVDHAAGLAIADGFVEMHGSTPGLEAVREYLSHDSAEELHSTAMAIHLPGGAAIAAAERDSATKEKVSAVLVAVAVHALLLVGFGFWALTVPPPEPPGIIASPAPRTEDVEVDTETVVRTELQQTSASSSTMQPVITSAAISNIAIPDNFDATSDLSMASTGIGNLGFGMSMSGFGEMSGIGALPPAMQSRCSMSQRLKRLRESGGDEKAERAVRDGLAYLTSMQNEETGAIGRTYTAGMTGLSLLAYLGHCETPESKKFGDSVIKAALFLMETAKKNDGKITNGRNGHHEAYEHAIATYALSELYTMTNESGSPIPRLDSILRDAVKWIVDGQMDDGGWPYGFAGKGKADMSVSGWQIQALKAAHNTGRKFSGVERALDRAVKKYLPEIQDKEGAFKYNPDNPNGKLSLTGAALLGMQIWKGVDTETYAKGFKYLTEKTKSPSLGSSFYSAYYNTQVFFLAGGPEWDNYNSKFQTMLLDAQHENGSWRADAGRDDGVIMTTAWSILMLEVYYRYLPTTDKVDGLEAKE